MPPSNRVRGEDPSLRTDKATKRSGNLRRAAIGLAIFCVGALAAEVGIRWAVEGGFGPALASIQSGDRLRPVEVSWDGLVFDAELGYRRDPGGPAANPLDVSNPASVPAKPSDAARILLVGGSAQHDGDAGAERPDDIVNLLRAALGEQAQVLDASVPGYTTRQERLWLERNLLPLQPDLVVIAYTLDDNHPFLYRLDAAQGLVMREQARRATLPADGGSAGWLAAKSYLALRAQLGLLEWRTPSNEWFPWDFDYAVGPAWRDESWKTFANELAQIKTLAERAGAGLLLAIFPIASQFDPELSERDARYVFKPQIKALEAANSLHIAALDLVPEFQRQDGRTLFEANGLDLNARGQLLAADALKKRILDSGVLPDTGR